MKKEKKGTTNKFKFKGGVFFFNKVYKIYFW